MKGKWEGREGGGAYERAWKVIQEGKLK